MSNVLANEIYHATPGRIFKAGATSISNEIDRLPVLARYSAALLLVGLATGVALAVERHISAQNVSLFYVIPVVISATLFGWGESVASVIVGVLAFDFFFTEPKMSFDIASPADIWAAAVLFVTASIVSGIAAEARRRADEALREAGRAEALRELAHVVIEARPAAEIIQAAVRTLNEIFGAPAIIIESNAGVLADVGEAGGPNLTKAERRAAQGAIEDRVATRSQSYPHPDSRFDFWPVNARSGCRAVLGIDFTRAVRGRPKAVDRSVEVVAAYVAIALGGEARD